MNGVEREMQRQTDEEIIEYVRQMEQMAPVTEESVYKYLVNTRRRKLTEVAVKDRLNYLTSATLLEMDSIWDGKPVNTYIVTAYGRDVADRNVPWPSFGK